MIRTKVLWLEQAVPEWEEVVEQDAARCDALRLAELEAWQREEGRSLPMPADLILWLEDRGLVVDLLTGGSEPLVPLQQLIDEAADTDDYEWDIDDRNIWRRGGW
jgi:phosphoserine phosphatase